MSEATTRVHPTTLARAFFDRYRHKFSGAAIETVISKQGFHILQKEWDEFLVEQGVLEAAPEDYNSNSTMRRGSVMRRNEIRNSINAAAIKADDHPAFAVSAAKAMSLDNGGAGMAMRVKLISHYMADRPIEIARKWASGAKLIARETRRVQKLAQRQPTAPLAMERIIISALALPIVEAVQKTAERWEQELRRTDLARR
jgi:hypothetical protein